MIYVNLPDGIESITAEEAVRLFGAPEYRDYVSRTYRGEIGPEEVPEEYREAVAACVAARTARWGAYADQPAQSDEVLELVQTIPARPLSRGEAVELVADVATLRDGASDAVALSAISVYPRWEDLIGKEAAVDARFVHNGKLYRVLAAHTYQTAWEPGVGTESLYARIDETHAGTRDDPIPYEGNMALTAGLYYVQDGAVYLCTRDTGSPVYHDLRDLVGLYVEKG